MTCRLEGLDCENRAAKIEKELRKIGGLSDLSISFVSKTVSFDPSYETAVAETLKKVDPNVVLVSEVDKQSHPSHSGDSDKKKLVKILLSVFFLIIGLMIGPKFHGVSEPLEYGIFLIAYIIAGWDVIFKAFKNISKGTIFDENFLMTAATAGAFAIHQLPEAVGVMLFYSVGEYIQGLAVNRSKRSIESLMNIRPDYANVKTGEGIFKMNPDNVNIGDIIVVKPGERIPLDGKVVTGNSYIDTSSLTGEPLPKTVGPGDEVLAGTVNIEGLLEVSVTKPFSESSVSKILDLVRNAGSRKAKTEKFITRFARYYTPAVVFGAIAVAVIPPLIIQGATLSDWIYRSLTLLVISCPCALVISIPLGYFGGIGGASRKGILIKGANFLEALVGLEAVVFDKTGTLTEGVFRVMDIHEANGYSKNEILKFAAYAENNSTHPIARSIKMAFDDDIREASISKVREIAGNGVEAFADGHHVLVGNHKLMLERGIIFERTDHDVQAVYVAIDGKYAGKIIISDKIREDAQYAVQMLKNLGKKTVMLTGDSEKGAANTAKVLGIDEYFAGLLPEQKVEKLEEIQASIKAAFLGDGINDAPVISRADVGMAMGGLGSDAAIEAADIVIMDDKPSKIVEAIQIALKTKKVIVQNIVMALGIKGIFIVLGVFGAASMWGAVFADAGVALMAVLNSTRTLSSL